MAHANVCSPVRDTRILAPDAATVSSNDSPTSTTGTPGGYVALGFFLCRLALDVPPPPSGTPVPSGGSARSAAIRLSALRALKGEEQDGGGRVRTVVRIIDQSDV